MSEDGRRDPAMNALWHGIFSKALIVHGGLTSGSLEEQAELDALMADMISHYNPVGPVERVLVEKIVSSMWRLRRVLWFERTQIAGRLTTGIRQALDATEGQEEAAEDLRERARLIRQTGRLTAPERKAAEEYFGRRPVKAEDWATRLEVWALGEGAEAETEYARITEQHAAPDFGDQRWDLVLRYDSHFSRQLHKDIRLLEELQEARTAQGRSAGRKKARRGPTVVRPDYMRVVGVD